jgi:hypothetical protein
MADFSPLTQLFAADAISGLILAMQHGLSSLQNYLTDHFKAFESEQRIPNAAERACGAMKFLLPSAAMCRSKNSKISAAYVLFFACAIVC